MDELFIGSALCDVSAFGELLLPQYFRETAQRRSADPTLFIGVHETSPCLVAFDRAYAMQRQYEGDAQRLPEDPQRLRRAFGFVDRTTIAPDGMITLPALMRDRGHIGNNVLLVATGQRFEIWDLAGVLQHGPSDLTLLATHHRMAHIAKEVLHVPALPSPSPCRRAATAAQSGLCVQPMPALRPRHDPVGRGAAGQPVEKGAGGLSRDAA